MEQANNLELQVVLLQKRILELESLILQNKVEATGLKAMLDNSIFVKPGAIETISKIISNSENILKTNT